MIFDLRHFPPMALKQHLQVDERYRQQVENARDYVIPFIEEVFPLEQGMQVMEIGCDVGGVLTAFLEKGVNVLGVDLKQGAIEKAKEIHENEVRLGKAAFATQNVYEEEFLEKWRGSFDLIVLKDTIEHIPNQEKFIPYLIQFLKPDGKIFFGFPPWCMPFGGHQQICRQKITSKLPYYHLLPRFLYQAFLKAMGEPQDVIKALLEIHDTGISIHRFERIIEDSGLDIAHRTHYLINPIYKYKFGLKPRKQAKIIIAIPYLRDFVTTCIWYVVGKSQLIDRRRVDRN